MNVVVYDKSSGRQVGEYIVYANGLNYSSSEEEHFRLAYKCLVEDGQAGGKSYDEFRFIATS